jgi:Xaa-Pro dipeptidase
MAKREPPFSQDEYLDRQQRTRTELRALGLDALLLFKIEDMYWLCGYESDGFCIFGCMLIGTDGGLTHLARPADLGNLAYTSICEDVRVSPDTAKSTRAEHIKDMLAAKGLQGKKVGIQVDTMGLTPRLFLEIRETLAGWCDLAVAPDFIRELRLIKSPKELDYVRKAGEIMDTVMDRVIEATHPGAFEGDIYVPPFGSGTSALNLRYTSGRKHVLENDQVTLELGLAYRHFHVASLCVVLTGPEISERHLEMHAASVAALEAVQARMRVGTTVGDLYDAYRGTLEEFGETDAVLTVCSYTMGAAWPPTWMEQPLIYEGNPTVLRENMTFFTHMILNDRNSGLSMAVGEQGIVTEGAPEIVTHAPREPVVRG